MARNSMRTFLQKANPEGDAKSETAKKLRAAKPVESEAMEVDATADGAGTTTDSRSDDGQVVDNKENVQGTGSSQDSDFVTEPAKLPKKRAASGASSQRSASTRRKAAAPAKETEEAMDLDGAQSGQEEEDDDDEEDVDVDTDFSPAKGKSKGKAKAASKAPASKAKAAAKKPAAAAKKSAKTEKTDAKKKPSASPKKGKEEEDKAEDEDADYFARMLGPQYDRKECQALEKKYPSPPAQGLEPGMIGLINADNPLELVPTQTHSAGNVYGIAESPDGNLLASVTSLGEIFIWDLSDFSLLTSIRDKSERHIDEFFVVRFSPDSKTLFVGGKRKSRTRWDPQDDDNAILHCHIKVFDVATGERVGLLQGHTEEILHILLIDFKGENTILSGSQDGTIIKWTMDSEWRQVQRQRTLNDATSNMVFHLMTLPGCGNRYLVAAADSTLKVFDLETEQKVHEFGDIYTSYCDCVAVIEHPGTAGEYAILTRGVETLNEEGLPTKDNTCALHTLKPPANKKGSWKLDEVRRFSDLQFHANSYLCRIATNGRYIAAPTVTGSVYVWNVATGEKAAVLGEGAGAGREIRDILFSRRKLLITCGDDGFIKVYKPTKDSL